MTSIESVPRQAQQHRIAWRWHFCAALFVMPFVLWQSVTGLVYLWADAWVDARHPELRFVQPAERHASVDAQLAAARDEDREGRITAMLLPADPARATQVLFENASGVPYAAFVDPANARLLGVLGPVEWPAGWSRLLHGGWPLGDAGSWVLELGASFAIVMVITGVVLWWTTRAHPRPLKPKQKVPWRDVHAWMGLSLALFILGLLITALPWTHFWGGQVLAPLQTWLGQDAPPAAGFSPVFIDSTTPVQPDVTLDELVGAARARGLNGNLVLNLGSPPGAAVALRTLAPRAQDERQLLLDRSSGAVVGAAEWSDFPGLAKIVATGVDIHEGSYFGALGPWLNTAFVAALLALVTAGALSWWHRRPRGSFGIPIRTAPWPRAAWLVLGGLCVALPLLGVATLVIWAFDTVWLRVEQVQNRSRGERTGARHRL